MNKYEHKSEECNRKHFFRTSVSAKPGRFPPYLRVVCGKTNPPDGIHRARFNHLQ